MEIWDGSQYNCFTVLYGTPFLGKSAHPWDIRLLSEFFVFILKTKSSNLTYLSTNGYMIILCKYTPPLLLDMHGLSVAALGRLRVDKSNRVVYPSFWRTDPFWVPRWAVVTFLAKNGYFPVVSFLDRQSEILLGNSDRSKTSEFPS